MIGLFLLHSTDAQCTEPYDDDICAEHTGNAFIRSPSSCQRWIRCVGGEIDNCGICPDGLYFNPADNTCTYPRNVECDIGGNNLCTDGVVNRVPAPDSCSIYYQCIGEGSPVEHSCAPGLHFDKAQEKCDLVESVRCLREPIQIDCPASDLPFTQEPHPWLCDRFFVCVGGVATEQNCLPGLNFDVNLRQCQIADLAECYETAQFHGEQPAIVLENTNTALSDAGEAYQCSDEPTYYKVNYPGDCQKYIQCIYGVKNIMSCVDGLQFHPEDLRCDFEENVNCT